MFRTPVLDMYVTGVCNLECPYCFGEIDTKPGMERKTFTQSLSLARFLGATVVEFCGGEPLLYRDLGWAVERARAEGFGLVLRTNGYLIPQRRSFIAENFGAVGISLDGDAESNDRMRPLKRIHQMNATTKLEVPFQEIAALKALNPKLRVILASVATAENVTGMLALGRILLQRNPPLDLWKIHQFVANNFRAIDNQDRFTLSAEAFASLQRDVEMLIGERFEVICRKSYEIDGSCLVINRDGDVLLGARRFGNVVSHAFEDICRRLEAAGTEVAISTNKSMTYRTLIPAEPR